MSTFVVTIFPDEAKAYEAVHALKQLHDEASITLYDTIVVQRKADHTLDVKERGPGGALTTGVGALLGALFGALGGPAGVAVGVAAGGAVGAGTAIARGDVSDEFLEDIGKKMAPGNVAVLAEVSEDWPAPIDTRMAQLGGTVLREKASAVVDDFFEKRTEAHRAEFERRKLAHASKKAQHKEGKFEDDIAEARDRLQRTAEKARQRLDDTKRDLEQKLEALEDQAQKANPEVKHDIEERIAEIRKDFGERERKLSHAFEIAQEALQP